MTFFLLNYMSKLMNMCRMDTLLSLTLSVSEVLAIPRTYVETHFLKKLAFVNNKCFKMPSESAQGQQKTFQNT